MAACNRSYSDGQLYFRCTAKLKVSYTANMHGKDAPAKTTNTAAISQNPPAAEGAEKKRRSPNKIPDGFKKVSYLVSEADHAALEQAAKADDREVPDYLRVHAKRHARQVGGTQQS